ncbi:hypothetical protein BST92_10240 [Nonlabens arenilitoris]|uniref:DUF4252 domain-containing protein n=1 Tax=Nonlabens arenilitoris TaxID=1217969 RepID=A0A2S7UCE1_9FLAO|nr:hypothetical protein [Nonlabens arenilitoris]PQJ32280.1 hypothetical protein BST92_10240 [Nonlabens arenilitoris]
MKTLLKASFIFVLLTTLSSCLGGSNKAEKLDIEQDFKLFESKKFSIKVPGYLTETDDLNEDAEMQMQNMFRETYMIVMAESKSDFDFASEILGMGNDSLSYAENYMDMQLESMTESFSYDVVKEKTTTVINDMPAMIVEANASIDGLNVSYIITTIESDHDIFYITCWTLTDRRDRYFPAFYQSVETIQQLEYDVESDDSGLQIDYDELLKELEQSAGE